MGQLGEDDEVQLFFPSVNLLKYAFSLENASLVQLGIGLMCMNTCTIIHIYMFFFAVCVVPFYENLTGLLSMQDHWLECLIVITILFQLVD